MNNKIVLLLLCIVLAACGSETKVMPDTNQADNGVKTAGQTVIALPPSYGETPGVSPSVSGFKGVSVDDLFSENIEDEDQRFKRLEMVVSNLYREFHAAKPTIEKLISVENDIQALIEQLDILLQEEGDQPPHHYSAHPPVKTRADVKEPVSLAPVKVDKNVPVQVQGNAVPVKLEGNIAQNFRLGQHHKKTRLVLDLTHDAPHSVDLDNSEKLLIIEMPNSVWKGPVQRTYRSPIIESYITEPMNSGKGTRFVINLKKETQILAEEMLKPGTNPYHRFFVDLKH